MILTLTGKNRYELHRKKQSLVDDFLEKQPDAFGVERFGASDADASRIIDSLTALPFLSSERLVVVAEPVSNKELVAMLPAALPRIPETTTAIFVEPGLLKKDKLYAPLSKHGQIEELQLLGPVPLRAWLNSYIAGKGADATTGAVNMLLDITNDQFRLANEIDKLVAYDRNITEANVRFLIELEPRATIFEMLDNLTAARIGEAINALRILRQNRTELGYIISMLAWQLHLIVAVWSAKTDEVNSVAKETGFSAFSIRKSLGLARRLDKARLRQAVSIVASLDLRMKTRTVDEDAALEAAVYKLAQVLS